jgi:hypothetical protein
MHCPTSACNATREGYRSAENHPVNTGGQLQSRYGCSGVEGLVRRWFVDFSLSFARRMAYPMINLVACILQATLRGGGRTSITVPAPRVLRVFAHKPVGMSDLAMIQPQVLPAS